jgi:hypothetical protein
MLYLSEPSDHNYRAEVTADADAPIARDEARGIVINIANLPELLGRSEARRKPAYAQATLKGKTLPGATRHVSPACKKGMEFHPRKSHGLQSDRRLASRGM